MTSRQWASRGRVGACTACAFALLGCDVNDGVKVAGAEQALLQAAAGNLAAGAAAPGSAAVGCVPVDTHDSLPDRIDEDCDGRIDEDVDATKASCPFGFHIVEGTRGDDVLVGTPGRDCILGYGGNDTIYGLGGDDLIFGGPGNDTIYPGSGNTLVFAGAGDDTVDTSGAIASIVYGGPGQDTLKGGAGFDSLYGGPDNDILQGGNGSDVLNGDGCHDLLIGGSGFDFADGGADFDACDAEVNNECEKTGNRRVNCTSDSQCRSSERCAEHVGFCVPRTAAACSANTCAATSNVDTTCDGVDDDCDGVIDDDYEALVTHCGSAGCAATGATSCVAGSVVDSCLAAGSGGDDSTCDNFDDDCDGRIDEGFQTSVRSCGVGACINTGGTTCTDGTIVDSCLPRAPTSASDTVCNGRDDDCDGNVDEDVPAGTSSCGVGACARTGTTACLGGVIQSDCQPAAPASSDTNCDGVDDDCNGSVDDGFIGQATACGADMCTRQDQTACIAGAVVDSCRVDCEGT
jgi:hypothetical protein